MSKEASYDSEKKINETKQSINDILKPWDNEVYVFDFGHYYELTINDDKKHYFFKTVIKGSKRYIDTLFPNGNDETTDYRYFDRSIKEVCNISDDENENNEEDIHFELKVKEIVAEEVFDISVWATKLQEQEIGGCLLASSIVAGNHQSAVWVVLNKPIKGLIKGRTYCFMPCEMCKEEGKGYYCSKGFAPLKDDIINTIFSKIDDLLINELVYNSEVRTKIEIYHESTYAAISQVFVRNIAHNHIPNILDILSKEKGLLSGIKHLVYERNVYKSDIKVTLPLLVGNFFSYVSNRSKYLNDATFKATYVEREEIESVYKLFIDFDANRILLNNISNKPNFKYKIVFKHKESIITDDNDIFVSLPAGNLGAQAFYNILENIISNTAEYNELKSEDVVTFTVNFIDKEPLDCEHPFPDEGNYYRVEIWDNVPIYIEDARFKKEIGRIQLNEYNEYFNVDKNKKKDIDNTSDACAENNKDIKELIKDAADLLVYQQNTRLNKSIIDHDTHRLRPHYLGLIEMETSAAFLRQEKLPEIESDNYDLKDGQYYNKIGDNYFPYFIQAFKHPLDDGQNRFSLGYRFYMKKPEN